MRWIPSLSSGGRFHPCVGWWVPDVGSGIIGRVSWYGNDDFEASAFGDTKYFHFRSCRAAHMDVISKIIFNEAGQ